MVVPFLIIWGTSILFSKEAVPISIPTNSEQGFPFLYIPSNTYCLLSFFLNYFLLKDNCLTSFCLFDNSHCNMCEVMSHCGFDLHFPESDIEHLSMYLLAVVCFLWKNIDSDPLSIFQAIFFWLGCVACRILVPRPVIEPMPLRWKLRVLITGTPGNSLNFLLKLYSC